VVGGIVLFAENISEQKRAEIALAESEAAARRGAELLNKTMDGMDDIVVVVDGKERLLFVNAAARAKLGERNCRVGSDDWKTVAKCYAPDGVSPVDLGRRPLIRALHGEDVDNEEMVMRFPGDDGRWVSFIANARPLLDSAGRVGGAVVIARDLTNIRATEHKLQELQKMEAIGQLTGGIAHDFNNILTVITGASEMLVAGLKDRSLLAIAKMIDDAATRGAALTQQLLAFARRQPLRPRESDVNALIADTIGLLRPVLGGHVQIESTLGDDIWLALVDPTQFCTAMLNLALNARDAMPDGGRITFTTENIVVDGSDAEAADLLPGDYVKITMTDTGTGIPAAFRSKVFEPFFTTKQPGKGTGLGLSMVYGFIKQSQGHIEIASCEGQGTAVRIYLPRSTERAVALTDHPPVTVVGGIETILVVEDDELVRKSTSAGLQSLGYKVLQACDGREALAVVDAGNEFALLFTDVLMPGGLNGRQLAEEVIRRRPSVKVLYTSGYAEDVLVHNGRLDPKTELLVKPYHKAELARAVRDALDS
jgi:signal transduction histidine kinase